MYPRHQNVCKQLLRTHEWKWVEMNVSCLSGCSGEPLTPSPAHFSCSSAAVTCSLPAPLSFSQEHLDSTHLRSAQHRSLFAWPAASISRGWQASTGAHKAFTRVWACVCVYECVGKAPLTSEWGPVDKWPLSFPRQTDACPKVCFMWLLMWSFHLEPISSSSHGQLHSATLHSSSFSVSALLLLIPNASIRLLAALLHLSFCVWLCLGGRTPAKSASVKKIENTGAVRANEGTGNGIHSPPPTGTCASVFCYFLHFKMSLGF